MYTMGQSRIKTPVWILFVIQQAHLERSGAQPGDELGVKGHVVPARARLTKTGTEQVSRAVP